MKHSLKRSLALLFTLLFLAVLAIWAFFYALVYRNIYNNAKAQLNHTANQIIDDLGREFSNLEKVCYTLSHLLELQEFTLAQEVPQRLELAQSVTQFLNSSSFNPSFADHVVATDQSGRFYRFSGKLSNASCQRFVTIANELHMPQHLVVQLDGKKYIGYGSAIGGGQGRDIGIVSIFMEEGRLIDLLNTYVPDNSLHIAISVDGQIISANTQLFSDQAQPSTHLVRKHIGITPFEILAAADRSYLSSSTYYFSIASVLTVLIFLIILLFFLQLQNRRFFSPMLEVIQNVESLDVTCEDTTLPMLGTEDFDQLTEKINELLSRLSQQNRQVRVAALLVKNAEIAKQKAIIFSLKKQINAHFTINTLSTISMLLEQGDFTNAEHTLNDLSSLIRYAYDKNEFINVWDEFHTLQQYVAIMNVRYSNKLELHLDVDDRLMDAMMPRMLLQPIVENSILHGFHAMEMGCVIEISAQLEGQCMQIVMRDNGRGMEAEGLAALQSRLTCSTPETADGIHNIALLNIKNRLTSYYQAGATLHITSCPTQGTVVTMQIPL